MQYITTCLVALAVSFGSTAQVALTPMPLNPMRFSVNDLLSVSVINTSSQPIALTLKATLTQYGNTTLCFAQSAQLIVQPGSTHYSGREIIEDYGFSESPVAQYLASSGLLLSGTYELCVESTSSTGEFPVSTCIPVSSSYSSFLQLISPYDGQLISEKNPLLAWTHSGILPTQIPGETFELILSPKKTDQSAIQSLQENELQYYQPVLLSHNILYPVGIPPLEIGQQYAWQVIHRYQGTLIESSDCWWFELDEPEDPRDLKYIDLNKSNKGVLFEVYQSLYFRADDVYNSAELKISITDDKSNVIEPTPENDIVGVVGLKKNGFNGYRLNLNQYHLKNGYYTVHVSLGNGLKYSINIHYNR